MKNPTSPTAIVDPLNITPDELEAEIQSVLHSPQFERSEKLQKFLRFICDTTIRGEASRINEYLIGAEVFLRGPDYSPSEDSVVRRQAHTLRQKLQEFYSGAGSTHAVRIELPVGRYVPSFRRILESPSATTISKFANSETAGAAKDRFGFWTSKAIAWGLAAFGAVALLVVGYFLGSKFSHPPASGIGLATLEFWGPWVQQGRRTAICFSSPMTAVIKHFDQELPPDTVPKRLRAHADQEQTFHEVFRIPSGGFFYFTPAVNQTKMGEAVAGVQIASLFTRLNIPVRTTQSRFVSWEDLGGDDLILLGNNEGNQWLDPLLEKSPFQLKRSAGSRQRAILNTHPLAGERAEYVIDYGSGDREGDEEYALISMLPGIGPNQRLLLISGLNAQATQAAAEYLCSETSLSDLLSRFRKARPQHSGPWRFQAVLKAEVHDKVPTKTSLMAIRIL